MGVKIKIRAPVYPTESVEKIKDAILLLFPDAVFEVKESEITATSESIDEFAKILKEMRIRDAARHVFLKNLHGERLEFRINKQVATKGKISFSVGDAPLGDITVVVESPEIRELIEEIAPDTRIQK
ncbi:MAG: hypothetical protein GXO25_04640 [Euryarchaeota archaeon]|nr:hypothetical protein [Euryarchaeota archaeon]